MSDTYTNITQLPDDFPFGEMGKAYQQTDLKMHQFAAEWGMTKAVFKQIRKAAPKLWTKAGPNFWYDDLEQADEVLAKQLADQDKIARVGRKASRKQSREERKAAESWWRLESAIEAATASWAEADYSPPKPTLRVQSIPQQKGALLINSQDWHLGKRARKDAPSLDEYITSIKEAYKQGVQDAFRTRRIDALYLVTGGDLVHVDNTAGSTTKGTPQDLVCSPSEALAAAIELVVWCVDYARSLGADVHVMTTMGNHDRMLSAAAGMAVRQRFVGTEEVVTYELQERVYASYGEHLILATHGDMKKKQWKQLPSIMMHEARKLLSDTRWQTVVSGHLHFQAVDVEDTSGTLYAQGSSPSPTDAWHYREGYVGSRKGLQMLMLAPNSAATSVMHLPV